MTMQYDNPSSVVIPEGKVGHCHAGGDRHASDEGSAAVVLVGWLGGPGNFLWLCIEKI